MEANTLLAAARLAYPQYDWSYEVEAIPPDGGTRDTNRVAYFNDESDELIYFSLANPADAHALMLALMEIGVQFIHPARTADGLWCAFKYLGYNTFTVGRKSVVDTMLAAVETLEAMK